jgi:hypothetical protein
MKKIVLVLMGLVFLSGSVSAYQVNIEAPDTLTVGKPLIVNGTTTYGIGTPIDVVLYKQVTTSTWVDRKIAYVQSDRTFRVIFDTTDLKKGAYKVEVPVDGQGDSVTMRLVNLVDRSDEISLTSPVLQPYSGKLYVAGSVSTDINSGIQIAVFDSDDIPVFGPHYVNTNSHGMFSADVPISQPGDYEVSFTDSSGYIGSRIFSVAGETAVTIVPTRVATTLPVLSAHGKASRNNPVYFIVRPASGSLTLYTSSSIDWVIEYIDEQGIVHMVNEQGEANPEKIQLIGKGKPVFIKVYPYKSSVNSEAFLYAENAIAVSVSPTVPAVFGTPAPAETQHSPVLPLVGILATGLAGYCWYRRV